jgi:hypothetical protein
MNITNCKTNFEYTLFGRKVNVWLSIDEIECKIQIINNGGTLLFIDGLNKDNLINVLKNIENKYLLIEGKVVEKTKVNIIDLLLNEINDGELLTYLNNNMIIFKRSIFLEYLTIVINHSLFTNKFITSIYNELGENITICYNKTDLSFIHNGGHTIKEIRFILNTIENDYIYDKDEKRIISKEIYNLNKMICNLMKN